MVLHEHERQKGMRNEIEKLCEEVLRQYIEP